MIDRDRLDRRIRQQNAALIGRAYDTTDPNDRQALIDWLLQLCLDLGLDLKERK